MWVCVVVEGRAAGAVDGEGKRRESEPTMRELWKGQLKGSGLEGMGRMKVGASPGEGFPM